MSNKAIARPEREGETVCLTRIPKTNTGGNANIASKAMHGGDKDRLQIVECPTLFLLSKRRAAGEYSQESRSGSG